jgi:hypothetical protein
LSQSGLTVPASAGSLAQTLGVTHNTSRGPLPFLNHRSPPPVPETSAEVLWLALSFLALPLQRQSELLEPSAGETGNAVVSDADLLQYVIETHAVAWQDEFEPCVSFQTLLDLFTRLPYPSTYEQFLFSPTWAEARMLAAASLSEAGLPSWSIEVPLSFEQYVEVHSQTPRVPWLR